MKALFLSILILLFFNACAQKTPGIKPPFLIYPYEFYEKFNLRTILSSYDGYLKFYCVSYPKDFFTPEEVYMPNTDKVVIESKDQRLTFELFTEDKVIVTDEHFDGSYQSKFLYDIYYNEEHDDFRTSSVFIPKKQNCKEYEIPPREEEAEPKG